MAKSEYSIIVTKEPGRARTSGAEFEYKLSGLVYLRAKSNPGLRFLLASNVGDANPIDDLFLRLWWQENGVQRSITYFVQLKHSEKRKWVPTGTLLAEGGDFSLKKYFTCYKKFVKSVDKTVKKENEKFIFDCNRDDIRFIIYTNRPVVHEEDEYRKEDFPFSDLFVTGRGEDGMFCFSGQDKEVWDMLEGTEDNEMYTRHFLPHLLICSEQADAKYMEPLLQEQLSLSFRGNIARKEHFSKLFLSRLHRWWDEDEVPCLSHESSEAEDTIKEDIRDCINEEVGALPKVTFTAAACEKVVEKCSNVKGLHAVSPGVNEELRCAKFQQALYPVYDKRCVIINSKTLTSYPVHLLESTCAMCDIVVVVTDRLSQSTKALLTNIKDKVTLIVSTSALEDEWVSFMKNSLWCNSFWNDRWRYRDLNSETQNLLFTDTGISFQAHKLRMRDLRNLWPTLHENIDGKMISSFVSKIAEEVCFVRSLPSVASLYQNRSLQHATTLRADVLNNVSYSEHISHTEHLVLCGFPKEIFPELYATNREDVTLVNALTDEEQVKARAYQANIHWLSYTNRNIVWHKTDGSADGLVQFIEKKSKFCSNSPLCSHIQDVESLLPWNSRFVFVAGEPGIGKTTFLVRLSHILKQKNPTQWVILMFTKSLENSLKKLDKENVSIDDVIDLMAEALNITGSPFEWPSKDFLRWSVMVSGNAVVLVDGVDEVCPIYKEKAFRVIKMIRRTRVSQIWITSRTNLDHALRREFSTLPLTFHPFTREDQANYLKQYVHENESDVEDADIDELVETLGKIKDGKGRSILDVPLHVDMVAEIYFSRNRAENEKYPVLRSQCNERLQKMNYFLIYKMFVDMKLYVFQDRHSIDQEHLVNTSVLEVLKEHFEELHKCSAIVHLFAEQRDLDLSTCREFLEKKVDMEKEKTGIISSFVEGKANFVHQSFAEYFAALWLVGNVQVCMRFIKRGLFAAGFMPVRRFFDFALAEGFPLHEAVLEDHVESLSALLSEGENVNQKDAGGRLALHLAASYGREEAVKRLLEGGSDLTARDHMEWTPLRYADSAGEMRIAEQLMQQGAQRVDMPVFNALMDCSIVETFVEGLHHVGDRLVYVEEFFASMGLDLEKSKTDKYGKDFDMDTYTPLYTRSTEDEKEIIDGVLEVEVDKEKLRSYPLFYVVSNGTTRVFITLVRRFGNWFYREDMCEGTYMPHYEDHFLVGKINVQYPYDFSPEDGVWLRGFDGRGIHFFITVRFPSTVEKNLLHVMALDGDCDTLKVILGYGMNVNAQDCEKKTPLHVATGATKVYFNKAVGDCFALLMDYGADSRVPDIRGRTPCHGIFGDERPFSWDEFYEKSFKNVPIRRLEKIFLSGGKFDDRDEFGRLIVHYAAARGCLASCRFLVSVGSLKRKGGESIPQQVDRILSFPSGTEVRLWDAKDVYGHTPVYYAVVFGREKVVEFFLERGADASWRDDKGASLLHVGCQTGYKEVVQVLVETKKFQMDEKDGKGRTCLHYLACPFEAVSADSRDNLPKALREVRRKFKGDSRCEVFAYLLEKEVDVNARDCFSRTLLHYTSQHHAPLLAKLLVESGVSMNIGDVNGITALHFAAMHGRKCVTKALLELGADYETRDKQERTPLFNAARNGHTQIVRILADVGADINASSVEGNTPLIVASCNGFEETVELLVKKGAENKTNHLGQGAVHAAAHNGYLGVVRVLLDAGMDAHLRDKRGFTPFDYAQHFATYRVSCIVTLLQQGDTQEMSSFDEPRRRRNSQTKAVSLSRLPGIWGCLVEETDWYWLDADFEGVGRPCKVCNAKESSVEEKPLELATN